MMRRDGIFDIPDFKIDISQFDLYGRFSYFSIFKINGAFLDSNPIDLNLNGPSFLLPCLFKSLLFLLLSSSLHPGTDDAPLRRSIEEKGWLEVGQFLDV